MGNVIRSNRDLWQLLTGRSVVHPVAFVADELSNEKGKLLQGLNYYQRPIQPSGEALKNKKLDDKQKECIGKISRFIGLDELQTYDVYCSYLMHEYRGSKQELKDVLNTERHVQHLMQSVRDYYFVERLYLLRCVKQLLSCWQESPQVFPYAEVYSDFVKPLYENETFIKKVVHMYKDVCSEPAPTWETHGTLMNDRQASTWLLQNIKEQNELLEIMFLYYKNVEHEPESLCDLAGLFKRQGFGRRQLNKHLLDEIMDPIMSRIGFLQVMILIEGVDVEDLQERYETNTCGDHHLIRHKSFKQLDAILCSLGDIPPHGPIILLWSLLHQMAFQDATNTPVVVKKCGNKALEMRVYQYLAACLQMEPFSSRSMVGNLCHSVVYGLLTALLAVFDEATLGDTQGLYDLTSVILKRPFISDDFWKTMDAEGLRSLLSSACLTFPLDAKPLLSLCASLASSSPESAKQVIELLKSQQVFTEYLDKHTQVKSTMQPMCWLLTRQRRPYPAGCSLTIPEGTIGKLYPGEAAGVVQWEISYDAFDVFVGEFELLLAQVASGAGMVEESRVQNLCDVCKVLRAILQSDLEHAQLLPQLSAIFMLVNQVVQRFSQVNNPPLDLLAACLDVLSAYVAIDAGQVWHNMRQTGLLPFLTEHIDNVSEIAAGTGLNPGYYGRILAGLECTQGVYPVTMALLNLVSKLVKPLSRNSTVNELTACVMLVTREIFPQFHKWRYAAVKFREKLGQRCLSLFHNILNLLGVQGKQQEQWSLRDVTVYSLLYTESGKTLLHIIGTGVDHVQHALNTQASSAEGSGVELIQMIRLAFSVLNRLLLLRTADTPASPVEHCLSAQPANRSSQHVVTVIAQYMYHGHDTRLPTLATLLLKRIAALYPMSILACLSNHAEPIVEVFLTRLQARTGDIRLKVGILELLTVCVETQPGLLEIFLNLKQVAAKGDAKEDARKGWSMGGQSCLHTLLTLIEHDKQGTYQCPGELLCAAVDFTQALWRGQRHAAMSVMREQKDFWPSLCLSLTRDVTPPAEPSDGQVLSKEIHTCATIMKIIAEELYLVRCLHNDKLDMHLDVVLKDLNSNNRFEYWSKYLLECMECAQGEVITDDQNLSDHYALQLLLGLRDLLIVIASAKEADFLKKSTRAELLSSLLEGVACQLTSGNVTALNMKLASIASAAYLTMLKRWIRCVDKTSGLLRRLGEVLDLTCISGGQPMPSVQIGLVASITHALQHTRTTCTEVSEEVLQPLVGLACTLLQQTGIIPAHAMNQTQLKLQIVCVYLLEELVQCVDNVAVWLPLLKQHSTIQCLVTSLHSAIQAGESARYVQAVLLLFVSIARFREASESISLAGLTQHVCLNLSTIYNKHGNLIHPPGAVPKTRKPSVESEGHIWLQVYSLAIGLHTRMLSTLRYNFLPRALDFVGCHQERMAQCLDSVGSQLDESVLSEAIHTLRFISALAEFRKEWLLHLPQSLNLIMIRVCTLSHRCVALLIRPRWLQHKLEKRAHSDSAMDVEKTVVTAASISSSRRLSQQSSLVDLGSGNDVMADMTSEHAQSIHGQLMQTLACCFDVLKQFSPDLTEILLDQSFDIGERLLEIGFSTPGLEQDALPSFGTLLSCANMCVRILAKLEGRGSSPNLSQAPEPSYLKRGLLHYSLENALLLIMSQAVLHLKHPALPPRDKQLLKRELATELNSIISGLNRHLRRSSGSGTVLLSPQGSKSQLQSATPSFTTLLQIFVSQVLT